MKDKKILAGLMALALAGAGALYMLPKLSGNATSTGAQTQTRSQTRTAEKSRTVNVSSGQSITKGGTYTLSGENAGTVYVNTKDDVTIILDGAQLTSERGPAIYVEDAGSLTINTVSDSSITVSSTDSNGESAAVFSKDDITLTGSGTLTIESRDGDGIHANDALTIDSAVLDIKAGSDGIDVNEALTYTSSKVTIDAEKDGINSGDTDSLTSSEDVLVTLNGGTLTISSGDDGIQSLGSVTNNGTDISIVSGGGRTGNTATGSGMMPGWGKMSYTTGEEQTDMMISEAETLSYVETASSSDSESEKSKGISVDGSFLNASGDLSIDALDDGINCAASITVKAGTITVKSDDDCIHADYMLTVDGGTLKLTGHEGLEATIITINDGKIDISATDDAINAGQKVSGVTPKIEINGGEITITMSAGDTDAVDSNGDLIINGGTLNISAQFAFDCDGNAQLNGGTVIVNGTQVTSITTQMMGGMGQEGAAGMMPGQGGMMPGQSGMMPGQSGTAPGQGGMMQGKSF